MSATSRRALLRALAIGLTLVGGPVTASAQQPYMIEACVVERRPAAALMSATIDRALFELDLRSVPASPFALHPDECVVATVIDRSREAGRRREFPQTSWLLEAVAISAVEDRVNRGSPPGNPD
jgi:hypothetical protein